MSVETGAARDLPRERYLRVAALQMQKSFGPEVLRLIAERGDDEFVRVAGQIFHSQGFTFTHDELRAVFRMLDAQAWTAHLAEARREDAIDRHGRSERPS